MPDRVPRSRGADRRVLGTGPRAPADAQPPRVRRPGPARAQLHGVRAPDGGGDEARLRRPRSVLRRSALTSTSRQPSFSRRRTPTAARPHPRGARVVGSAACWRSAPRPGRARGGGVQPAPRAGATASSAPLTSRSSTRRGTRFRARRATCPPTRRSSLGSAFPSRPAARSRGSTRPTRARWRRASVRGSPSARPSCCGTAAPCWSSARRAATSSRRPSSRCC